MNPQNRARDRKRRWKHRINSARAIADKRQAHQIGLLKPEYRAALRKAMSDTRCARAQALEMVRWGRKVKW